jgi:hypothetical protein
MDKPPSTGIGAIIYYSEKKRNGYISPFDRSSQILVIGAKVIVSQTRHADIIH